MGQLKSQHETINLTLHVRLHIVLIEGVKYLKKLLATSF